MSTLADELDANREAFFDRWTAQAKGNWSSLKGTASIHESYRRLSAFGAVAREVGATSVSEEAAAFFHEAQNDALTSHVLAGTGAWRAALQCLRACIENTLSAIYYGDHPIELRQWADGGHKLVFTDLHKYLVAHPDLKDASEEQNGSKLVKEEYAMLSRAVHGSAKSFRMTDSVAKTLLWSTDPVKASMWGTREKRTIEALATLMVFRYRTSLQGARLPAVRSVLAYAVGTKRRSVLKQVAKINC